MSLYSEPVSDFRGNRLLSVLSAAQYEWIRPSLELVPLALQQVLITAHRPIEHVYFPLSGIISTVAQTEKGRIDVGLIGREGLAGTPVVLGADQSPYTSFVQGEGEALRIDADAFRTQLANQPALFRPFGLYVQALMVQTAQTAIATVALNIEARLARLILMSHDRTEGDELVLTHELLSAMLGVQRSSVTVAMQALEGAGLIRNRRGRIVMIDRNGLIALTGGAYLVGEDEYVRLMAGIEPVGNGSR